MFYLIFFTPYLGVGGGVLLNSVQSEYPGPADLAREDGSLALDEMGLSYGACISWLQTCERKFILLF